MIPYAFATLVLILSTISFCMYYEICHLQRRKVEYIESSKGRIIDIIYRMLPRNEWDADKPICIRQMWNDYLFIAQIYDADDFTWFFYIFTVLIALGNIVFYTIKEFIGSEKGVWDIIGIAWRILIPIVPCIVIWIVCLRITKTYKSKTFQSIKDFIMACEDEYRHYSGAETSVQAIIKEELEMKSKRVTRSTAVMIFFIIALLTLATSFFSK